MESLKKKRIQFKRSITKIYNFVNSQDANHDEIKVRSIAIDDIYDKYKELQDQIDELCQTENETEVENKYRDEIEDIYFAVKAIWSGRAQNELDNTVVEGVHASTPNMFNDLTTSIRTIVNQQSATTSILESVSATLSAVSNLQLTNNRSELRLPPTQIPDFDGDFANWIRFRDLFKALVDSKTNMADVEKLEYLQTKLKGEASSIIKHLSPTNDNYKIAWELILQNYDRPDLIEKQYFDSLFRQKPVKNATYLEFKRFYNNTAESYNALKVINDSIDKWDPVLLYHIEEKLDSESIILWRRQKNHDETQTFPQLLQFLKKRLLEFEESHQSKTAVRHTQGKALAMTTITENCPLCNANHFLFKCLQFKSLNINERKRVVQTNKLCFNCLQGKHFSKDCKSGSCRKCNLKHNTFLHYDGPKLQTRQDANSALISINSTQQMFKQTTVLPTAIIMVRDRNNTLQPCRALIDSGAQSTLVSESCVQRLHLSRTFDKTLLYGVGNGSPNCSRGRVQLEIFARNANKTFIVKSYCLSNLTSYLPSHNITNGGLDFFSNLQLADPTYFRKNRIDVILGADVLAHCMLDGKISHPSGSPSALNTIFGWVIMGNVSECQNESRLVAHVVSDIDGQLQKFWQMEECEERKTYLSPEEELAEKHFVENVERQTNGKYMVRLPFKSGAVELGESRPQALKRLESMERKFAKDENLRTEVNMFMSEYETLNHMQMVSTDDSKYFMPHHAVLKPSSTTTKLRVVFDASCKTSNGSSLNDYLLIGPTVQSDLYTILLRFRKYKIGFVADIEKMYRQIAIHPADRPYQAILWRDDLTSKLVEYQLTTVTYGTAAAPFLATRTLKQVALDNVRDFPKESAEIINNFYVDDYLSSSHDLKSARYLYTSLCSILSKSGFNLRKWASNSQQFEENIAKSDRASSSDTNFNSSTMVKTLGLLWNTTSDSFQYNVVSMDVFDLITKRRLLSEISKIYDPMGWISPVVVKFKIFMQKLWLKGISWDQELPIDIVNDWLHLKEGVSNIENLKIPRWFQYSDSDHVEIHGFSDASELAYAAAVYIRIVSQNGLVSTSLLTAKTRVAPLKQVTLPRLELCAAHLLVKIIVKVKEALQFENISTYGWTDSTVVLAWINDHPRRWKTFIANRTSYIINILPALYWHHIPSKQNPADLATRGISVSDIFNNSLWWNGPQILQNRELQFGVPPKSSNQVCLEQKRKTIVTVLTCNEKNKIELIDRYSDLTRLLRITALLFRFVNNCKLEKVKNICKVGFITTAELNSARRMLIKCSQKRFFGNEIQSLTLNKPLGTTNKLMGLTPFLDEMGILRVGGRLRNASISYEQKHPFILHKDDNFTQLIVTFYHKKHLHAGIRQLQYLVGLNYWIPNVTYLLKRTVYKCTTCMRYRQLPYQQRMGDLPSYRVQAGSTFVHVGIDFAGPLLIRSWKGRGSKNYKCWIAVFICLGTKAIHLEAVTELTTAAFLASLRRFTSRRGKSSHIYTDNGTNFVGCNQQIRELYEFLENNHDAIYRGLAEQRIQWHFIPPSAPNFGGIWEAGVKSMKFHLKRVLGNSSTTYEELTTLLCQIECCLNSRPLCQKFEGDPDPLTPGHFLILRPLNLLPDENLCNVNVNRLTRWQYIQQLLQHFWVKWSNEYLTQLQKKPKWVKSLQNLQTNDMVLVKDENLPPAQWLMGKVLETHPGGDGLVRVATIKTKRGVMKRPVSKLCPLFINC